jgi:hypothetical protein
MREQAEEAARETGIAKGLAAVSTPDCEPVVGMATPQTSEDYSITPEVTCQVGIRSEVRFIVEWFRLLCG